MSLRAASDRTLLPPPVLIPDALLPPSAFMPHEKWESSQTTFSAPEVEAFVYCVLERLGAEPTLFSPVAAFAGLCVNAYTETDTLRHNGTSA
jgi:hypothetical protein